MNIVKISKEVFETIQNNDILPLDKDHMPYNKITIAFPYSFLRSAEEMIQDAMMDFKKSANERGLGFKQAQQKYQSELNTVRNRITKYCDANLYINFEIQKMKIQVVHSNPQIINLSKQVLFSGEVEIEVIPIPVITKNEMSSNGIWFYKTLLKLISGVIYAMNNPNLVYLESSEQRTIANNSNTKKSKRKFNNIKYITNIRYISNNNTPTRKNHVYSLEAWEVRGHWRHLKSGKIIWVSSYVKGDKDKLHQKDNIYKLNKIEIEGGNNGTN